jgi:hypothetical protein
MQKLCKIIKLKAKLMSVKCQYGVSSLRTFKNSQEVDKS